MARWIKQTLSLDGGNIDVLLEHDFVCIGTPSEIWGEPPEEALTFRPTSRDQANQMAIALRLAAKRLEDMGKGMR